eukprot:1679921-Pyramimonas_sp.AAC.1
MKGVCDTCGERRVWEKHGQTVTASTALPGKFNGEVECDLVFYSRNTRYFIESIAACDATHTISDGRNPDLPKHFTPTGKAQSITTPQRPPLRHKALT